MLSPGGACPQESQMIAITRWILARPDGLEGAPRRVHERLHKKELAERDALTAGADSEWGRLVN